MELSELFLESINIDENLMGGRPVLNGTRFPVSQLLEELSENQTISEICIDYNINKEMAIKCLKALAILFDGKFL